MSKRYHSNTHDVRRDIKMAAMRSSSSCMKTVKFKLPEEEGGTGGRSGINGVAGVRNPNVLPKTPHPRLLENKSTSPTPPPTPPAPPAAAAASMHQSVSGRERPQSRPSSDQRKTVSLFTTRRQDGSGGGRRCRNQSDGGRGLSSDVTATVNAVRERTNSESRHNIRSLKYSVSRLRESLLQVEEEVKHTVKGRRMLELAVQDIRKGISVNQQSLSVQQKKTRTHEDSNLHLLREEAHTLSKCKSEVEQYLKNVNTNLQSLDNIRRALKTRITSLSQSLELDAQCFKVYRREKEFRSVCAAPTSRDGSRNIDESIATVCREAAETTTRSQEVRGGIEGLIVTMTTRRTQAHSNVTAAVARSVVEANHKKREMLLEKGQMRLSQNSVHHQQHNEQVLLGRILGPVSEIHRSVSEKEERPLSRRRPGSSAEEKKQLKQTTSKLAKKLSSSAVQMTEMEEADHHLTRQLKRHSLSTSIDCHTLRIRKISLDNRWVL